MSLLTTPSNLVLSRTRSRYVVQGELFHEERSGWEKRSSSAFGGREIALGMDNVILLVIASVVLFVLSYSFGYERGYRAAERKIQSMTAHIETVPVVPSFSEPTPLTSAKDTLPQVA